MSDQISPQDSSMCLRRSEEYFQVMADAMPQIVWTARPDGYADYYNRRWYEFTGFVEGEGGDNSWKPILHPEDLQPCLDAWYHAVGVGEPYEIEYRFKDRKTGGYRWFLGRALPVRDAQGRIIKWFGTCTDIDDQKQLQQKLRESEERLRLAQQVARIGTFEWNIVTGVNQWTPELEAMYGLPAGGFKKTEEAWEQLVYPKDRPEAVRRVAQALETGVFEHEWRVRWPDGSLHWINGRAWVFKDQAGKPVRLIGVNIDITERKLAEEERALALAGERQLERERAEERARAQVARAEREQLAEAQRLAHLGTWEWDLVANTVTWSEELYRIRGMDPRTDQPYLESAMSQVHPDDCALVRKTAVDAMNGKAFDIDYRIIRPDGSLRHVHGRTGKLTTDAAGRPIRLLGTVQDVTELRQAEEESRQLARFLDSVIENLPSMVFVKDARTLRYVRFNRAGEELIGKRREELLGKNDYELFSKEQADFYQQKDREVLSSSLSQDFHEETLNWINHEQRFLHTIKVPIFGATGEPLYLLGIGEDITERKRFEQALARRQVELERSNRELEQFAYAASHDLKAPLRAIDSLSKWLEQDLAPALTPENRQHLTLLRGRVARMEKLLDDLLAYGRATRGKIEVGKADVAELVAEAIELSNRPASFQVEVLTPLPVLHTAVAPLRQIFVNLIGNAIKHHDRPAGHIRIAACDTGEFYEFIVADDGPGIPVEFHDRVFQMFQTLKPRDAVEGSGMGLALVKSIVERALGQISIDRAQTAAERGTTIRFTWPKKWDGDTPAAAAPIALASRQAGPSSAEDPS